MTVAELVPAQTGWRIQRETTGGDRITFSVPSGGKPTDHAEARNKMVREAILTHIKALRKLGQTRVNTRDIAVSLSLPHSLVEQVVGGLEDKGVKVAK